MLSPKLVDRFQSIVIIALFIVVPIVLTRNDQIVQNAIDQHTQNASIKRVPFVEYYIEHNVSQDDAKRSFFEFGVKLIDGVCEIVLRLKIVPNTKIPMKRKSLD